MIQNINLKNLREKYKNTEFVGFFKEIFELFKPHTYVELGVKKGYTFNQLSPLVSRAIAVDLIIRKSIIKLNNVETYEMTTDKFSSIWKDPIDFLFIDADHKKEQVLKDFENCSKFVKSGTGIIALHDTHPIDKSLLNNDNCSNSWEAAWEIRKNQKYSDFEIITLPGPFAGLSLIRKSKEQLSWRN